MKHGLAHIVHVEDLKAGDLICRQSGEYEVLSVSKDAGTTSYYTVHFRVYQAEMVTSLIKGTQIVARKKALWTH